MIKVNTVVISNLLYGSYTVTVPSTTASSRLEVVRHCRVDRPPNSGFYPHCLVSFLPEGPSNQPHGDEDESLDDGRQKGG
jgi:hypothetical protein